VLVHECAHAIRRDPLIALYQRLLSAFLWFHPLVHLANALLNRAREDVCDNWVLRGVSAVDYSRTLLTVAESVPAPPRKLLAPSFFESKDQLQSRVAGLLNSRRCLMTATRRWKALVIAGLFLGTGAGLGALAGAEPSQKQTATLDSSSELSRVNIEIGQTY